MSAILNSGLIIFDIIKALLENVESREEISLKLKEKNFFSNPKTITKYLTTLRKFGFEIKTLPKNNYEIVKTPFKINIDEEFEGFIVFKKILNELFKNAEDKKKEFEYKIDNLVEFSRKDDVVFEQNLSIERKTLLNFIQLKKHIKNKEKIRFSYNRKESIVAFPIKTRIRKNGFFLDAYIKKDEKIRVFKIENIGRIRHYKDYTLDTVPSYKTTFRVRDALMKNYILREGESAQYKKNSMIVTNLYEEKEELFSRLIKYGVFCKVISPKKDKTLIINKLEDMLQHYKSM